MCEGSSKGFSTFVVPADDVFGAEGLLLLGLAGGAPGAPALPNEGRAGAEGVVGAAGAADPPAAPKEGLLGVAGLLSSWEGALDVVPAPNVGRDGLAGAP